MIKQLFQTQSITIIGGADGPTSIYILSSYLWQIIVILICVIALSVFGTCKLIKSIRNHNKGKIILWSFVLLILTLVFVIPVWNFFETRKKMKILEADIYTTKTEEKYCGFPTEANDFNYFSENNKNIEVYIGFAGTGFIIKKTLETNHFKCIKVIYGSGVSVVAEEDFTGTVEGNVFRLDNDNNEFFILKNNVIRYFYQNEEYLIYDIIDNNMTYKI